MVSVYIVSIRRLFIVLSGALDRGLVYISTGLYVIGDCYEFMGLGNYSSFETPGVVSVKPVKINVSIGSIEGRLTLMLKLAFRHKHFAFRGT